MTVAIRQKIEREIVAQVIDSALKAGYQLSVDDGEEITLKRSTDKEAILKAMFTTDEDRLCFYKKQHFQFPTQESTLSLVGFTSSTATTGTMW